MIDNLTALSDNKVLNNQKLSVEVSDWRKNGESIVFTNGVFDLLHVGHLSYLLKASSLCDKFIVGLNADESVKRLKGDDRPINNELSRALILASFFYIDAVVIFKEDTPINLINLVKPDMLVKGGDYTIQSIVGADDVMKYGGKVQVIEFIEGHSSTRLIEKIKSQ